VGADTTGDEVIRERFTRSGARRQTMKPTRVLLSVLGLLVGMAVLASVTAPVVASSARAGVLKVTKECSQYTGAAGSFCTITYSNLPEIAIGSKVLYSQAAGVPAGLLDSNVVLDAGNGDRAVGRCTLDLSTGLGICTFSDGTGQFAGFHARVDVFPPGYSGIDWLWNGTYGFTPGVGRP
jgi:hypothetical protein